MQQNGIHRVDVPTEDPPILPTIMEMTPLSLRKEKKSFVFLSIEKKVCFFKKIVYIEGVQHGDLINVYVAK